MADLYVAAGINGVVAQAEHRPLPIRKCLGTGEG
jgi:hypothetical protein